ncbi:hypothetical protein ACIXIM_11120 [Bacteroides fragilis]
MAKLDYLTFKILSWSQKKKTKSGWEIAQQASRIVERRNGSDASNPNNLVNRIQGRYLGNFNRIGMSWNKQVSRRTYMGNANG